MTGTPASDSSSGTGIDEGWVGGVEAVYDEDREGAVLAGLAKVRTSCSFVVVNVTGTGLAYFPPKSTTPVFTSLWTAVGRSRSPHSIHRSRTRESQAW